ncbi:Imm59 family immunity protein, partial [Listeria monocytogenes]
MTEELREYKNIIEDAVNLLGYTPLRHAIFEREKV